jgi:hypothetical protein
MKTAHRLNTDRAGVSKLDEPFVRSRCALVAGRPINRFTQDLPIRSWGRSKAYGPFVVGAGVPAWSSAAIRQNIDLLQETTPGTRGIRRSC